MTNLTHEQARELVHSPYLPEDERQSLRQHLNGCAECRAYAALNLHLFRTLPQAPARQQPSDKQRAAILAAANQTAIVAHLPRPLVSLAGMAALLLLIIASWLVIRSGRQTELQPPLPAPWATLLAPYLPQPTPTAIAPATPTLVVPTLQAATPEASVPTIQPTPDPRGRYVVITVPAPSLAGNVIGEPVDSQVVVYLPPSYDISDRRFPVIYALISATTSQGSENEANYLGTTARSGMNLALRQGAQEMIVVMPDSVNALSLTNFFVDSPATGNWEPFVAGDLVDYIDAHYRTLPAAESRGLFGEHAHGLGALTIAMNNPDVFGSVYLRAPYLFSPDQSILDTTLMSDLVRPQVLDLMAEAKTWPAAMAVARLQERFSNRVTNPLALSVVVAFGLAYAPNVEGGAPFFDYPYTDAEGSPNLEILQKWQDGLGNIEEKLQPFVRALRRLDIAITYYEGTPGYDDSTPLHLSEQLTTLGVPHAITPSALEYVKGHGGEMYPWFSRIFASE